MGDHGIRVNSVCPGNVFEGSKIWNPEYINICAKKYGIRPEEVKFVDVQFDQTKEALESGRVAAIATYQPKVSEILETVAGAHTLATSREFPGLILDVICVRASALRAKRAACVRLVRAVDQAVREYRAHPERCMEIVAARTGRSAKEWAQDFGAIQPLTIEDNLKLDPPLAQRVSLEAINEIGLFDESLDETGDVIDLTSRLILASHQFAGIDHPLNYHFWNGEFVESEPYRNVDNVIHALVSTFSDPRCPKALLRYKNQVLGDIYLYYSYLAFLYTETSMGQEFLRKSIRFNRSILDVQAKKFLSYMILACIGDGSKHGLWLQNMFNQLRPELAWLNQHRNWSIAHGYIYCGVRAIMWGRLEDASQAPVPEAG